jgi:hypothetical protein
MKARLRVASGPVFPNTIVCFAATICAARSVDAAIAALAAARGETGPAERHPERRMKSAYAAYEERELPKLKDENPGLRLSQLKNLLQKQWKKSPENPMNQAHVAYNAEAGAIPE